MHIEHHPDVVSKQNQIFDSSARYLAVSLQFNRTARFARALPFLPDANAAG